MTEVLLEAGVAPLIPLRDVVVFPDMVTPLFVGREKSIQALNKAMANDKKVVMLAQRSAEVEDPNNEDLFQIGTLASILQLLKLPDGTVKVLVEGSTRVRVNALLLEDDDGIAAEYEVLESYVDALPSALDEGVASVPDDVSPEEQAKVLMGAVLSVFEQYVKLNTKVPSEVVKAVTTIDEPARLCDSISAHLNIRLDKKQELLEALNVLERLELVLRSIETEIDLAEMEKRVRGRVRKQMEKSQREYYLNEQMKAIQKELGDGEEGGSDLAAYAEKIAKAGMPKEAKEKADSELSKLKMMSQMSAEAAVVRNYLDWLLGFPWKKKTRVSVDLDKAQETLDSDHYGLEKVKERIVEYLAVQQRVKKMRGPILCLVGPPGVGKTSLGQSIAKSTNRKFSRIALGGVRDEAEIRGHRRTYIGAMPGKLVQKINKTGVKNPMVLLDEIDKMSTDFRGDPSSALLEVLDPEQNSTFNDHYLEVDCDLSEVMFVCTANSMNIPGPLLDRMEVIRLSGYTEDEKLNIAKTYLVPKQVGRHGLKPEEIEIGDEVITDLIRYYTREAGVRNLEREVAKLCRKAVRQLAAAKDQQQVNIQPNDLEDMIGVRRFRYGEAEQEDRIGQVTGLAWTEVGGDLLTIESAIMSGKGRLLNTGHLGDVMKESVQAAMTVVRSRAQSLGIDPEFNQKFDVHIHVPEGATPKDGPSAGSAMTTALVSALTGVPVKADVAMTGEITLRGEVLPIGGLKEKLLAAQRGGIRKVLIPEENVKDLREIPENVKGLLEIVPVRWVETVFEHALEHVPTPETVARGEFANLPQETAAKSKSTRAH